MSVLVSTFCILEPAQAQNKTNPSFAVFPVPIEKIVTFSFDHHGNADYMFEGLQIFDLLGNAKITVSADEFSCGENRPQTEVEYKMDFNAYNIDPGIYLVRFTYKLEDKVLMHTSRVVFKG